MFTKRSLCAVLLASGSIASLSGCGSSSNSTLSYSAFSNAANKICQSVNSVNQSNQATATANAASAAAIAKVIPEAQKGIAKLEALKGPAALESARDAFDAINKQEVTAAQQAESAAKSGNQSAYTTAATQAAGLNDQSNAAGSKLGAPACASQS